eukprot:1308411-Pyramimonas_sp.AAC.1
MEHRAPSETRVEYPVTDPYPHWHGPGPTGRVTPPDGDTGCSLRVSRGLAPNWGGGMVEPRQSGTVGMGIHVVPF